MAIFRLRVNIVSRARGQSALASAAYRAGEKLHDPDRLRDHDYTRKSGVEHTEIMAPATAPDWVQVLDKSKEHETRQLLWQRVEEAEVRKNAQLAREVVVALPHELDKHQRVQLVRDYVTRNFTSRGMVADVALHEPEPGGNPKNFHAHILLTMREVTPDGLSSHKQRAWNEQSLALEWREDWARTANKHLERAGRPERIDHRSNEARGIDREPQPKLGPLAHQMEKHGRRSRAGDDIRAVKERNLVRDIEERGDRVIDTLLNDAGRAQHPLAKQHALERLERVLDDLDRTAPDRGNGRADAHDARKLEAGLERVSGGLGRAADSTLDIAGGVLSFFEPGGPPKQEPRESLDDRIARLEGIRDQLAKIEQDMGRARQREHERAREEEDERGRERDRLK